MKHKTYQASRHVKGFGCRVDHLIDGLHREVEGHEFTNWPQASLKQTTKTYNALLLAAEIASGVNIQDDIWAMH